VLQWIQFQLDNCATIDEVIATDKKLRIISNGTPLHYLIADAKGNAATIEFLNGKITVHKGSDLPFPVLTNDTYERLVAAKLNGSANGNNSLERFTQACSMVKQYESGELNKPLVEHSFDILGKVAQGDYTKWSIVYDISNKKIFFKTQKFHQIRSVDFSSVDFSCNTTSKTIDMNEASEGDISHLFKKISEDINRKIVEKALEQSKSQITVTTAEKEGILNYPAGISCN
jgi:choloylglycine hydrolase